MKKLVAVSLVLASGAALAQSSVTLYGIADLNIASRKTAGGERVLKVDSSGIYESRFGFKGSEDLGGGLSAIWQMESTVSIDDGGWGSARNTFVGLKGGFGTVLLGKHDTPMKMLGRKVDNFGDTYADSRNLLGTSADTGSSMFDLRTSNTIAYISPNFSGVTVTAAYVADHEVNGTALATNSCAAGLDCNERDAYSVTADYTNGPLMLGLGYERHNTTAVVGAVTNTDVDRSMWRLVGGYSFGNFKLGALYERGSADDVLADADRNAWGLFGNYAMGNVTLKANYLSVGDYKGTDDSGANQYTLGVDYALSKRTTAYALYAKVKNDNNAEFDIGRAQSIGDTTTTTAGDDPSVFGVGIKHVF